MIPSKRKLTRGRIFCSVSVLIYLSKGYSGTRIFLLKTAKTVFVTSYGNQMWVWWGGRRKEMQLLVRTGPSDGNGANLFCDCTVSLSFTLRLCLIPEAIQSCCTSYKTHTGQGVNSRAAALCGAMKAAGIT